VQILLKGFERAAYVPESTDDDPKKARASGVKKGKPVNENRILIDHTYDVQTFDEEFGKKLIGQTSFPFELDVPEHLPSSVMLEEGNNSFSVMYYLIAQVSPVEDRDYARV